MSAGELFFFALTIGLAAGDTCSYYNSLTDQGYLFCSDSCCGDYYARYCCAYWSGGGIAGLSVGLIAAIVITIIAIIVCRRRRARLIYARQGITTPGANVTVVSSQMNQTAGMVAAPPPQYPAQPYPAAQQPNPGAQQPYPGAQQPYPGAQQPYPPKY